MSVINWSEHKRWLCNHEPHSGPWANIALPPYTKLPVTLCPVESHFSCHFVSWSMTIRHILGPIPRIMYWVGTNIIFIKPPGRHLQTEEKKKKGNEYTSRRRTRTRENLLPHIPGTNGEQHILHRTVNSVGLISWSPLFHQKLIFRMTVTSVTLTLEISKPLGFICIFSVCVCSSQRPLITE